MSNYPRTIIIGLDGVPLRMIEDFTSNGIMPNTAGLLANGAIKKMRSSIPEISSVAWSSIITAVNPAQHGIFGFIDLQPDSYKMKFPNFSDLKAKPFWDKAGGESVIVNVPSTYPVRQMNGVHISGFVSIDYEKSIHPKALVPDLKQMDYRLDVDATKARTSMDEFLEDVDKTLTARIKAYRYLWDNCNWQTFMLTFTGTDRLMHFLWNAYEEKGHQHHEFFIDHFRKIDQAIGEIADKMAEGDALIMLSDHGFERLDHDVYINYLLAREGFLQFQPGQDPSLNSICPGTKAFALDPGRIFINLQGKFPNGNVGPQEKDACLEKLENLFGSLKREGKNVIKYVYRKQDVYEGPYLNEAADLILIAESGFNLKGAMTSTELFAKGPFTGKHTYEDAFVMVNNAKLAEALPDEPSVIDAGKLIAQLTAS